MMMADSRGPCSPLTGAKPGLLQGNLECYGRNRPRAKLEPFQALIGEWTIEMTHPAVEGTVVRGRATYEWLEGGRFLIQRATNEHPDFPDSLSVIGAMEGEDRLSMQYFDSRGVHRVYAIGFDGRELTVARDAPVASASAQSSATTARLSPASGS